MWFNWSNDWFPCNPHHSFYRMIYDIHCDISWTICPYEKKTPFPWIWCHVFFFYISCYTDPVSFVNSPIFFFYISDQLLKTLGFCILQSRAFFTDWGLTVTGFNVGISIYQAQKDLQDHQRIIKTSACRKFRPIFIRPYFLFRTPHKPVFFSF